MVEEEKRIKRTIWGEIPVYGNYSNGGEQRMKNYALFVWKGFIREDDGIRYSGYNPVFFSTDLDEVMREKAKYNDVFVTEILAIN